LKLVETEYRVKRGDTLSRIADRHGLTLNQLLAMNPAYKADPNRLGLGDRLQVVNPAPPARPAGQAQTDWFAVPMGQLTFDAEGVENERSRYHSRRPHIPGPWSGVTIGRGYDMRDRSKEAIFDDLRQAGVPVRNARKLSACAGYQGRAAKAYVAEQNLAGVSITAQAQYHLFLSTYQELAGDVIRICEKSDVIAKYGATAWDGLAPVLRDMVIDLRYRGDYTPATRGKVQPILVLNDPGKLQRLMADESYWRVVCNVPRDRFERRKNYF
jgi:hypothetical protein